MYAVGHRALSREGRWLAAVLACGRGALLSHWDAAAAWDLRPYAAANALIGVHRALNTYVRGRLEAGASDRRRLAREVRRRGENALALLSGGLGDYAPKRQKGK